MREKNGESKGVGFARIDNNKLCHKIIQELNGQPFPGKLISLNCLLSIKTFRSIFDHHQLKTTKSKNRKVISKVFLYLYNPNLFYVLCSSNAYRRFDFGSVLSFSSPISDFVVFYRAVVRTVKTWTWKISITT